jgi:hypothetical protein
MNRKRNLLDALDRSLRETLGLSRAEKPSEFTASGKHARYLREPKLTIASHFDIDPAFLLYDPLLGTLGLVELVLTEELAAGETVESRVNRAIDRASYLRHLLVRDKRRAERRPLTVELVLLTADETDEEKQAVQVIGETVRSVLRSADSLYHIGFGVLRYGGAEVGLDRRLRRAFPWLLTATRRWLGSSRARRAVGDETPRRRLRRLTLKNYRLSAERVISLAPARVHLLHGANGSGKSSVAEAIELVATGKIERLELAGETNYDKVVRHRQRPDQAAEIVVEYQDDSAPTAFRVVPAGIESPIDPDVDASSFRLDQPLMDRLVGLSPNARAQIFSRAFFPQAMPSLQRYEKASELHQAALAKLQRVVEGLNLARQTLVELKDWKSGSSTHTLEEFPDLLDRWLEQTAYLDLVQRIRGVRQTVDDAQRAGWAPPQEARPALDALVSNLDASAFARFEEETKLTVNELQLKLSSFATTAPRDAALPSAKLLTPPEAAALDAASPFLFEPDALKSFGLLGQKLRATIHGGDAPTYGPLVIGDGDWAGPLVKAIDGLLAACKALETDQPLTAPCPGLGASAEYDAARATHASQLAAGADLTRDFVDKLRPEAGAQGEFDGSLAAALNELLALFTPARWAYPDIKLPAEFGRGKAGISLHLDGPAGSETRAELHFNTAELNLFTIALFLLCAGTVKKPLNLIVLDDPLQNMDELTTTALARGLAKVVRLWEHLADFPESLLILFHGQDDLARFDAEIAAAVYRLPWLSASSLNSEREITAEGTSFNATHVQGIEGLSLQEGL